MTHEASELKLLEWYRTIGANIIRLRVGARMSQDELAAAARVGRSTIQAIEKGGRCNLTNLLKIATALEVSPADLFLTKDDRQEVSYKTKLLLDRLSTALSLDNASGVNDDKGKKGRADPDAT